MKIDFKGKKKRYIITAIAAAVVIIGACGIVTGQNMYYGNRWYPNTSINEYNVSAKTKGESYEVIQEHFEDYSLEINGRNNGSMVIEGSTIGYGPDCREELYGLFEEQHKKILFPWSRPHELNINAEVSYDEDTLDKLVNESELVCGSSSYKINNPVSAYIKYDEDKCMYTCIKEDEGNVIVPARLKEIIKEALSEGKTQVDLADESVCAGVYEAPDVRSDDEQLTKEMSMRNNAVVRFISWKMDADTTETVSADRISSWIEYDNGRITYDKKSIKAWAKKLCDKYYTLGKSRTIKTRGGKKVAVSGGDYGWQLDYEKTYEQLMQALKKEIDADKTEAYIASPDKSGKKALTISLKPIYLNSAYKLSTGKNVKDWDTKNYIEVSLSEQKVYVIRNGKTAFSCKCISGLPGPRQTTTGVYYLKEHRRNYTMVGEDYRTFVKCWVRITWTGIGFHPATWQPWGRWSRTLYMQKGSHGCINLTPADAEKIYSMSRYKEAVFIHG